MEFYLWFGLRLKNLSNLFLYYIYNLTNQLKIWVFSGEALIMWTSNKSWLRYYCHANWIETFVMHIHSSFLFTWTISHIILSNPIFLFAFSTLCRIWWIVLLSSRPSICCFNQSNHPNFEDKREMRKLTSTWAWDWKPKYWYQCFSLFRFHFT